MTWIYTIYAAVLHFTAILSAFVVFLSLRRRNSAGTRILALLMIAVTEWALMSGMEAAAVGIQNKLFWSKLEYIGALSAPVLFLAFVLQYCQKTDWLKPGNLAFLSIIPVIGFLVALTNDLNHLIWTSYSPSVSLTNVLIYKPGVGFYFLVAYEYLIILIGIFFLLQEWFQRKRTLSTAEWYPFN